MRIRRALEAESYGSPDLDHVSPPKRQRRDSTSRPIATQPTSPDYGSGFTDSFTGGRFEPAHLSHDMLADELQAAASNAASCDAFLLGQQVEENLLSNDWGLSGYEPQTAFSMTGSPNADCASQFPDSALLGHFSFPDQEQGQLHWGTAISSWSDTTYSPTTQNPFTTTIADERTDPCGRGSLKRRRTSSSTWRRQLHSPSPSSTNHWIAKHANESLISTNLLRIYHDVLEHNLSCWLTELTCPYQSSPASFQPHRVELAEWGSSWSNRLYHRTLKLEEAAKRAQLVRLSASEDHACSRALHLAIMAFATQWARGSRRQHGQDWPPPSKSNGELLEDSLGGLTGEFDREIQWHFWTQAEQALQAMTGVDSFRLACAEAILGLVQKPSNRDHQVVGVAGTKTFGRINGGFDQDTLLHDISQVISQDGPPKYLERAAARMHTLKFKFDLATKGAVRPCHGAGATNPVQPMSEDDQTSLGLLYWLAVMFDTVSSSMHRRPLTVSDQDCQHRDSRGDELDNPHWNIDLFAQDSLECPAQQPLWPCSYDKLAEAVTKSGPVKVLLYRHVAWLQNSLRRGQRGQKLEDLVRSAISLYNYWNATYGQLFRDLVRDFDCVPGRIRSWFVCISGHWHLAAMLLAELINTIDKQELGTREGMDRRLSGSAVTRIQETSAKEMSDLARVATPCGDGQPTEPQLPDFHPSVNEGTILTDPWTVILIQAFSKASVMLLAKADHYRQYALMETGGDGLAETIRCAQRCIRGLWFLGKQSDMAREVADILSRKLQFQQGTVI
ncbi:uncharacterized protein PG986_000006 [Apiospora aurea]|uniref:Regulatory protein alcR n=1 Tax=Apiospora aurea TaxID=335848 RepID=A0ABR1QSZ2_9PEZI